MSIEIKVGPRHKAIVDEQDSPYVSKFKWSYNQQGYAERRTRINPGELPARYERVYMHRDILKTPKGMDTDHINGDGLDNRRANIRVCTTAQNLANRTKLNSRNTTGYKGVILDKSSGLFVAQIGWRRNGVRKNFVIGKFRLAKEAAIAYELEARRRYGEFAKLELLGGYH